MGGVAPAEALLVRRLEYDPVGNVIARVTANGDRITQTFDELNRLKRVDYPDGTFVEWQWDVNGNVTAMADSTGTTALQHDAFNRLVRVTFPDSESLEIQYDVLSRVTFLNYPHRQYWVRYRYFKDGNVREVETPSGITSYAYDDAARVATKTLANGCTTSYERDPYGRLTAIEHRDGAGQLIARFAYILDNFGNRIQVTKSTPDGPDEVMTCAYDTMNRLTRVVYPDGRDVQYEFDDFNNRRRMIEINGGATTFTDYEHDANSRLLRIRIDGVVEEEFAWDGEGNMVARKRHGQVTRYEWNFENRLTAVVKPDGTRIEYSYHGDGRLWERTVIAGYATTTAHTLYTTPDPVLPLALTEWDGSESTNHIYGHGDALIESVERGNYRGYVAGDFNAANITQIRDEGGNLAHSFAYDVYGEADTHLNVGSLAPGYVGEFYDVVSGLTFLRARWFEIGHGMFLSQDKISPKKTDPRSYVSAYGYAVANPVSNLDRSGLNARADELERRFREFMSVARHPGEIVEFGRQLEQEERSRSLRNIAVHTALGGFGLSAFDAFEHFVVRTKGDHRGFQYRAGRFHITEDDIFGSGYHFDRNDPARDLVSLLRHGVDYANEKFRGRSDDDDRTVPGGGPPGGGSGFRPENIDSLRGTEINAPDILGRSRPGGVRLNAAAQAIESLGNITGAIFDPATGQVVLVGDTSISVQGIRLDDLVVAIRFVMDYGAAPELSIDPPPPLAATATSRDDGIAAASTDCDFSTFQHNIEPAGIDHIVRYGPIWAPDIARFTHMGSVMFETDVLFKDLSNGWNVQGGEPFQRLAIGFLPDYVSRGDRVVCSLLQQSTTGEDSVVVRFWLEPEEINIRSNMSPGGSPVLVFDNVRMRALTELLDTDGSPFAEIVLAEAENTVNWINTNWDELKGAYPQYGELEEIAKVVGLVQWIKDNDIPFDTSWVANYELPRFDGIQNPLTPATVPRYLMTTTGELDGSIQTVETTGGVRYCANATAVQDPNVGQDAACTLADRASDTELAWTCDAHGRTAAAVSVSRRQMDGGRDFAVADLEANSPSGGIALARVYDSFQVDDYGARWTWEPAAIRPRARRTTVSCDGLQFSAFPGVYLLRDTENIEMAIAGAYDHTRDPQGIVSLFTQFDPSNDQILIYRSGKVDLSTDRQGRIYTDQKSGWLWQNRSFEQEAWFDLAGRVQWRRDRFGNKVDFERNLAGRLLAISEGSTRIELSYIGDRITGATATNGQNVSYEYDAAGQLIKATYDTGQFFEYHYSSDVAAHTDGLLTEILNERGECILGLGAHDVYGRSRSAQPIEFVGSVTSEHDLLNQRTVLSGPESSGFAIDFSLDDYLPTRFTDARSNASEFVWNNRQHPIAQTNHVGGAEQRTEFFYNGFGDLFATKLPSGAFRLHWPDALTGKPETTGWVSQGTEFESLFDDQHIITSGSVTISNVDRLEHAYTPEGRLERISAFSLGFDIVTFTYDALGRRATTTDAENRTTRFAYDARSRLTSTTNSLGEVTRFVWDDRDRLAGTAIDNESVLDPILTTTFEYDARDHVSAIVQGDPIDGHRTEFAFDPVDGLLRRVRTPSGAAGTAVETEYVYNARKLLARILHGGRELFTFAHDDLGRVTEVRFAGTVGPELVSEVPSRLVGSQPSNNSGLPRSANNTIRLFFDHVVTVPPAGAMLVQELLADGEFGPDLFSQFTLTTEADTSGAMTAVKVTEDGDVFTHRAWYSIRSTESWPGVEPFEVQLVVQVGDTNGDLLVLNNDISLINTQIPNFNVDDDSRLDVNGDGLVLNNDVSIVNASVPSFPVSKPSGH